MLIPYQDQPTKRLNSHVLNPKKRNNIGRVRRENEMSHDFENPRTTNQLKKPLSLAKYTLYIHEKQAEKE